MSYRALIHVWLQPDVADVQGQAVVGAVSQQGFPAVKDVRVGKAFEVTFDVATEAAAREEARRFATEVLSNPVYERHTVELTKVGG